VQSYIYIASQFQNYHSRLVIWLQEAISYQSELIINTSD